MADSGFLIWITGLAGSGKTTLGRAVHELLTSSSTPCIILDGDELRQITGGVFGYDLAERKRCAEFYSRLCQTLCRQGVNVICCTISMFDAVRERNRQGNQKYLEVYLEADLDVLRARDQKQLYSQSRHEAEVAGLGLQIETPKHPDLKLTAGAVTPKEMGRAVIEAIDQRGWRKNG